MKKQANVGIIGYGIVGRGSAETLVANKETIRKKTGLEINLAAVADLSINTRTDDALLEKIPLKTTDANELINNPDIDIIVELIGGYTHAKTFMLAAINAGKHVVTANKALLAVHGKEIFSAVKTKGVEIGFEASVGGGIPIINVMKEDLAANNVLEIDAIINGTANYILSRMTKEGKAYEEILKDAQKLGYAEADPTFDVEGIDTAHKITLLSSIAFGSWVEFDKVYTEGITRISTVDIDFAGELDRTIKLLAIAKKHADSIEVRVHPTMVPNDNLLASVHDAFNAVCVTSDMADVTMHYGRGAGGRPTSSAVVADIINIARDIAAGSTHRVPALGFVEMQSVPVKAISEISSAFYLRLDVIDTPGVLSKVAGILAKNNISIRSALQRPTEDSKNVPLVFLTNEILGGQLDKAVAEINKLDEVLEDVVIIRIMQ